MRARFRIPAPVVVVVVVMEEVEATGPYTDIEAVKWSD